MARRWSMAPRLAFALIAVAAIMAMHGSSADAHTCNPGDHAKEHSSRHAMHADGGHAVGSNGDHDRTGGHEPTGPNGSAPQHCGPLACTAVVAPSPQAGTARVNHFAPVPPEQHRSPSDTPAALEPPVPRSTLHH